jgi:hypothetical protein
MGTILIIVVLILLFGGGGGYYGYRRYGGSGLGGALVLRRPAFQRSVIRAASRITTFVQIHLRRSSHILAPCVSST